MNVLFVYRVPELKNINSVVEFQRDSLKREGVKIEDFQIKQGGIKGYFHSLIRIRKILKSGNFDLIHAHYSYCGFVSKIFSKTPVVCSLMGSDVFRQTNAILIITKLFSRYFWKSTIVKNKLMLDIIPNSTLIPNGTDLENFRVISKGNVRREVDYNYLHKNVIFVADSPYEPVKNLKLAKESIRLLDNNSITLHVITGKSYKELPYYYNAADLLLLTSLTEGSPNVIKEAMACNCPLVSTDVGDVKNIIGDTEGCYTVNFDPMDVANKIKLAIGFSELRGRTSGRQRIKELGLDSVSIARRLIKVYNEVLNHEVD